LCVREKGKNSAMGPHLARGSGPGRKRADDPTGEGLGPWRKGSRSVPTLGTIGHTHTRQGSRSVPTLGPTGHTHTRQGSRSVPTLGTTGHTHTRVRAVDQCRPWDPLATHTHGRNNRGVRLSDKRRKTKFNNEETGKPTISESACFIPEGVRTHPAWMWVPSGSVSSRTANFRS
jgi:hypothetical protein